MHENNLPSALKGLIHTFLRLQGKANTWKRFLNFKTPEINNLQKHHTMDNNVTK